MPAKAEPSGFASPVHDLRTALAMIVGFAELLETRDDPRTRVEAARGILEATERLRGLVESITGLSLGEDAVAAAAPPRAGREPRARRRVLVIDGDRLEAELLLPSFRNAGWEVLDTRDVNEAFETLAGSVPDLVVLDWAFPGGGPEALAELKLRHPDVRVIVLADEGDARQRHVATLLDADEFVLRPLDPSELVRMARALV